MSEELLVGSELTREMTESGEAVMLRLEALKIPVYAALWIMTAPWAGWEYIIASVELDVLGPRSMYKKIVASMNKLPPNKKRIPLSSIVVRGREDKFLDLIGKSFLIGVHDHGKKRLAGQDPGVRISGITFGSVKVHDMLVYRMNTHSKAQPLQNIQGLS